MFERIRKESTTEKSSQTIVKVKTESYMRGDTLFVGKSIKVLKRKSFGFDLLNDHIKYEPDEMLYINNLKDIDDGEYELVYDSPSYSPEGEFDYEGFWLSEIKTTIGE
jgi:hypothetical protein